MKKIKEKELIKQISARTYIPQKKISKVIKVMKTIIIESLKKDISVNLNSLGTFKTFNRYERNGINPSNFSPLIIPKCKVAKFRAGSRLKREVKKSTSVAKLPKI